MTTEETYRNWVAFCATVADDIAKETVSAERFNELALEAANDCSYVIYYNAARLLVESVIDGDLERVEEAFAATAPQDTLSETFTAVAAELTINEIQQLNPYCEH